MRRFFALIGTALFIFSPLLSSSQDSEPCGTRKAYEKWLKENPDARQKADSMDAVISSFVDSIGLSPEYPQKEYPDIPGYSGQGSYKEKRDEYQKAKREYYKENPEEYRERTRNPDPEKDAEAIRRKERKENEKNQKKDP